jgi:head-tail adaptor
MGQSKSEFSGSLTQRLHVQSPQDMADGIGGIMRSWQNDRLIWAHVQLNVRDQSLTQGRLTEPQRIIVRCRSDYLITPQQRLIWRTDIYDIVQVIFDPTATAELIIHAQKSTA